MEFTTEEIAALTAGSVHGPAARVAGATQDSRRVESGNLFVPLVAERDGHDYITAALTAGATVYLTHREPIGGTAVKVTDTSAALNDLASAGRRRLTTNVIGITGSVGKTSTKDLLASVLRKAFVTHASAKSFNNEIGVPLTILNAPEDTEALVVEMGSRGIGHIRRLCDIARPNIGVITTVAAAHTGEFGSLENIARAKGELIEALPADGLAVLNGDVSLVSHMAARTRAHRLLFGSGPDVDVRFSQVEVDDSLRARFVVESPWGTFEVRPSTRGAHLVPNATAATATALWLGVEPSDVVAGLADAELSPWRMELTRNAVGATIINDTYNANPTSMRGALDALRAVDADRRIAVLGYMAELGELEREAHLEILDYARALGIEVVAAGTALYGVESVDDPVAAIGPLTATDAVLVKASRSAGLEAIARALAGRSVVDVEG